MLLLLHTGGFLLSGTLDSMWTKQTDKNTPLIASQTAQRDYPWTMTQETPSSPSTGNLEGNTPVSSLSTMLRDSTGYPFGRTPLDRLPYWT